MSIPSWPRFGERRRHWEPEPGLYPRPQAQALSGECVEAIAPFIADRPLELSSTVGSSVAEATASLVRIDAELTGRRHTPLDTVLARSEASASSQIEYVEANARDLAAAAAGLKSGPEARETLRNIKALVQAFEGPWPPTPGSIAALQATLMAGNPIDVGFRTRAVWIGARGSTPPTADYVAPHHGEINALVDDWVAFVERVDIPALAHVAIAHAHFEAIHPFEDGNGRTGRALVHSMLKASGAISAPHVPISAGLLSEKELYIDALIAYRRGYVEPICQVFATATVRAVALTRGLVERLDEISQTWRERLDARADAGVWRLIEAFIEQPVMDRRSAQEFAGLSQAATFRALNEAEHAGILAVVGSAMRSRVWEAPEVLDVLQQFSSASRRGYW